MFLRKKTKNTMKNYYNNAYGFCSNGNILDYQLQIEKLKELIESSDAIIIGAGAGLSTAAGLTYSGERFHKYFFDFEKRYGIKDIYSGGFYPFPTEEEQWAWWSRHIYYNRYVDPPFNVYSKLYGLVKEKDYFVLTTNVDHQFQRAGFDKKRLFYTQGDYGLFQSVNQSNKKTYDNKDEIMAMMQDQGFVEDEKGVFDLPKDGKIKMKISYNLIPQCKDDGEKVVMNLRSDNSFVEDEGWHQACERYYDFCRRHNNLKVLYLELGVGMNTPVIIKYPFWKMVEENKKSFYVCVNIHGANCPENISDRSVCINKDIKTVLDDIDNS